MALAQYMSSPFLTWSAMVYRMEGGELLGSREASADSAVILASRAGEGAVAAVITGGRDRLARTGTGTGSAPIPLPIDQPVALWWVPRSPFPFAGRRSRALGAPFPVPPLVELCGALCDPALHALGANGAVARGGRNAASEEGGRLCVTKRTVFRSSRCGGREGPSNGDLFTT